ncbi:peptidoglycan DD-metalloendopeptidase family protein [Sphingomonas yunnanensis]|uniref:M23 family metallopeptidase n=1 Tax=Sphingomonas yunnanensis TaxID=310400 RepID=UPI001CA721E3|nr:M23 family metallopeptidase [Sphingomonas yunnanensis]MBY9061460.1 peptidoglycan DD-metalloendopeptidase family protein [Sphingomonas yunnanensis]
MSRNGSWRAITAWSRQTFVDRELFLRTDGRVRFIRVSRRTQLRAAAAGVLVLTVWGGGTLTAVVWSLRAPATPPRRVEPRIAVAVSHAAPASAPQPTRAADDRHAVAAMRELLRRQRLIEQLVASKLGQPVPHTALGRPVKPGDDTLGALGAAQQSFARALGRAFDADRERRGAALHRLGLDAERLAAQGRRAEGGPLIPWPDDGTPVPAALETLAAAVVHWAAVGQGATAVPSGRPTRDSSQTSSFGVRADPFTGRPTFHAGLDFRGRYGEPIYAAAAGRVSFVGERAGYGRLVEIDHGNGIASRYGHLSGADVSVGEQVARGQRIARMGSTGRSTGTHVHFEVRLHGTAVNPQPFLVFGDTKGK